MLALNPRIEFWYLGHGIITTQSVIYNAMFFMKMDNYRHTRAVTTSC